MSQNLLKEKQSEIESLSDQDLSDYDDIELPKMQRMNALILIENGNTFSPVVKKNKKIYFRKRCPICLEKQKQLPLLCGHTVCELDLRKLIEIGQNNMTNIIKCCICRTEQSIKQVVQNTLDVQYFSNHFLF